jgi:hypothetical protein
MLLGIRIEKVKLNLCHHEVTSFFVTEICNKLGGCHCVTAPKIAHNLKGAVATIV